VVLLASRVDLVRNSVASALKGDAEAIHVLRVAARSLRTTLPALVRRRGGRTVRKARKALTAAIRLLGPVRDRDVGRSFLDGLPQAVAQEAAARRLLRDSDRDRARALIRCRKEWPRDLDRLLRRIGDSRGSSPERVARRSRKLARRCLRDGDRALRRLEARPSPARLHAVRKCLRELRYALDLVAAADPKSGIDIGPVKALQAALGDSQDLVVTARWAMLRRTDGALRREHARVWKARARQRLADFRSSDVRKALKKTRVQAGY
jgi:CHAD domain-containing protein